MLCYTYDYYYVDVKSEIKMMMTGLLMKEGAFNFDAQMNILFLHTVEYVVDGRSSNLLESK